MVINKVINVKEGVVFKQFNPQYTAMIEAAIIAWDLSLADVTPTITSAFDSATNRVKNSKHYQHHALDFRIRDLPTGSLEVIVELLPRLLGPDYDVILELARKHIHIEYDPKRK